MTTKTIYISNDGEEFESEEECLEYEKKRDVHDAIIMFDSNRLPILDADSVAAFEDAEYLYILDSEKAKAFFDYISEAYGYAVPNPDEVVNYGLYAFNSDLSCQSYYELNDQIAELEVLRDELLDRTKECITENYSD